MLDKSIPYFSVIMKRPAGRPDHHFILPQGFSFAWFSESKELKWAEIETSVGEFANIEESLSYFRKEFLPFRDELKKRMLFVRNEKGDEIGTITSWWKITGLRRDPMVHWFAVKKEYQGVGLGKALLSECLNKLLLLEGDKDVFLHTQTWSYNAIGLYLKAGFEIVRDESFGNYKNDYEKAMPLLNKYLK